MTLVRIHVSDPHDTAGTFKMADFWDATAVRSGRNVPTFQMCVLPAQSPCSTHLWNVGLVNETTQRYIPGGCHHGHNLLTPSFGAQKSQHSVSDETRNPPTSTSMWRLWSELWLTHFPEVRSLLLAACCRGGFHNKWNTIVARLVKISSAFTWLKVLHRVHNSLSLDPVKRYV
jgi:hypothetical protein